MNNNIQQPKIDNDKITKDNTIKITSIANPSTLGVNLVTRDPTSISSKPGNVTDKTQANTMLIEDPWTLDNMLYRPTFIGAYPWITTQAKATIIRKLRIPQDLLPTSIASDPFQNFTFWRGDVKLSLQVVGTPFHQGCALAVFVPLSQTTFIEKELLNNFSALTINQAVYLFANVSTAAEMNIRFNSPYGYLNLLDDPTSATSSLGYVYIVVFNPLAAAAGSSNTVNVSVHSQLIKSEFKVPRVTTSSPLFIAQGGKVSTINNWNNVSGVTMPMNMTGDKIDAKADVTAMDNATFPIRQPDSVIKPVGVFNYASGPEYLDKMHLYPDAMCTITSEHFATDVDEMDLDHLKKIYSYLDTFDISTSDAIGKALYSGLISPIPNSNTFKAGSIVPLPLLSYISYPMQYWRGGLNLKFQVVSTSVQTCKLFLACNFGATGIVPSLISAASQYGAAFEINQGSNEFEFSIPFVSNTPYKNVPNSNKPDLESSLGTFTVYVMNPLVAPNNTPVKISVNVFIAGAEDFELAIIGASNNFVPTYIAQSEVTPLNIAPSNVDMAETSLLAPNANVVTNEVIQFGHKVVSVKDILRKFQLVEVKELSIANASIANLTPSFISYRIADLFRIQNLTTLTNTTTSPGLISWGSHLFRQFRGSLRFKIELYDFVSKSNIPFAVYFTPYVLPDSAALPTDPPTVQMLVATVAAQSNYNATVNAFGATTKPLVGNFTRMPIAKSGNITPYCEFEIPFITNRKTLLTPSGVNDQFDLLDIAKNFGQLFVVPELPNNTTTTQVILQQKIYASLGDETRLGTLFSIPKVLINAFIQGTPAVPISIGDDSYN